MHRHGYQGRKFSRERDQRRALLKGLATSLIEHSKIETTLPKAKEVVPYIEALITKAKTGSLHDRRQIIAGVSTVAAAHKLVDEIAPKLTGRNSGHVRITRTRVRVGDNTQMATVSFVDDITVKEAKAEPAVKSSNSSSSAKASGPTPQQKQVLSGTPVGQAKKTQTAAGSSRAKE